MIDWDARIDDLMHRLGVQHAISDRLAIEVLLSARIECPRTCASWIILETNWHDWKFHNAWFTLGDAWIPHSLKVLRRRGGNALMEEIDRWMEREEPRLFIDADYERYLGCSSLSPAPIALLRSLRIRSRVPRTANPLRTLDWREREREQDELKICTRSILENRVGARPADPPRFIQPPWFLFYAELLQRLNPWFIDWRVLLIVLAGIAVRHAYLHGLTETGPQQNAILARCAADSIPPWIANALRLLLEKGPTHAGPLMASMGLRDVNDKTKYGPMRELGRLRKGGIIDCENTAKLPRWFIIGEFREGIEFLLTGRAFGMLASCA